MKSIHKSNSESYQANNRNQKLSSHCATARFSCHENSAA